MSINVAVIDAMASRLRDSAKELERLAAQMRATEDPELAGRCRLRRHQPRAQLAARLACDAPAEGGEVTWKKE